MRTSLAFLFCMSFFASAASGASAPYDVVHGTKGGLMTSKPIWSAGVQAGGNATTGVTAQKVGFYDGALSLGLGWAFGGFSLHGDYLVFFDSNFVRQSISGGYNAMRGRIRAYGGGGLQAGPGLAARVPIGAQYTMLKDPISLFAEVAPVIGPFLDDDRDSKLRLAFAVGIRGLL